MKQQNKYLTRIICSVLVLFAAIIHCSCTRAMWTAKHPAVSPPLSRRLQSVRKEGPADYEYQLAPRVSGIKKGYSRRELESFLFSVTEGALYFPDSLQIRTRNGRVMGIAPQNPGPVKKQISSELKKAFFEQEISKWFEQKVTVSCKGFCSEENLSAVKNFFSQINRVSGHTRFVMQKNGLPANIVIEFGACKKNRDGIRRVGESSGLIDPLKVNIQFRDGKLTVEEFWASPSHDPRSAQFLYFTPAEIRFQKKQRMVKVFICHISSPLANRRVIRHELLHAIGFAGHSPFPDCELFPLTRYNPADSWQNGLSLISLRMVEMLYRPEIFPGMSLQQAAETLAKIPRTPVFSLKKRLVYLKEKQRSLQNKKARLLEKWQAHFQNQLQQLINLDRLQRRETYFLEEWREFRRDEGLPTLLVDIFSGSTDFKIRKSILNYLLIRIKKQKQAQKSPDNPNKKQARQESLREEELVILQDLLAAGQKAADFEKSIKADVLSYKPGTRPREEKLRRIQRQLKFIEDFLEKI